MNSQWMLDAQMCIFVNRNLSTLYDNYKIVLPMQHDLAFKLVKVKH
jgi:hypothetical protein